MELHFLEDPSGNCVNETFEVYNLESRQSTQGAIEVAQEREDDGGLAGDKGATEERRSV